MNTKKIYRYHKWTGLIAGLFILILGLTGAILSFHEELESFEYKPYRTVDNTNAVSIDNALKTITQNYTAWDIRLQKFSADPRQSLIFQLRRQAERLVIFVHPSNGTILKVSDQKDSNVFWILKLHYSLHSGLTGEIIVFIAGLLFISSLMTGLIVYRKAIFKVLTFRAGLLRKRKRLLASTIHRYVGVWALVFNLLMALTGTVISYEIVKNGLKASNSNVIENPPISISIDTVINNLKVHQADFNPSYIRFPISSEAPLVLSGTVNNKAYFNSKFYNTVNVNPISGEIDKIKINSGLSGLVRGIHFMEYGNILIKLLFCLVGISGPALTITGFLLWKWRSKSD